jgi:hypothetical protein
MAKRYYGSYEGVDARRKLEREDSMMVPHHGGAHANMPENVVMRPYPKASYNSSEGLDDTIKGVDYQIREDDKGKKKGKYPEKY